MKKFIAFALAAMSLMACRNDDSSKETSIIGTWKLSAHVVYDGKTNNILSTEATNACISKNTYQFTNDGKVTGHIFEEIYPTDICKDEGIYNGTYKYDASKKTINIERSGMSTQTLSVFRITNTVLEIKTQMDYDLNKDGIVDIPVFVYTKVK